jgi:hypothetical protein
VLRVGLLSQQLRECVARLCGLIDEEERWPGWGSIYPLDRARGAVHFTVNSIDSKNRGARFARNSVDCHAGVRLKKPSDLSGLVSSGAAGFLCENKRDNYLLCWRLPIMLYFYFAFILM